MGTPICLNHPAHLKNIDNLRRLAEGEKRTQEVNMKKKLLLNLCYFLTFGSTLFAEDAVGFWKTINDETGKAESIVAIYPHEGKYYGRIIATVGDDGKVQDTMYSPKERAPGVEGDAYYCGMDIIWDLKNNGSKFTDGKILDPEKGKIYDAEMWTKDGNLIVRGEIWLFGENEKWIPARDNDFPQASKSLT